MYQTFLDPTQFRHGVLKIWNENKHPDFNPITPWANPTFSSWAGMKLHINCENFIKFVQGVNVKMASLSNLNTGDWHWLCFVQCCQWKCKWHQTLKELSEINVSEYIIVFTDKEIFLQLAKKTNNVALCIHRSADQEGEHEIYNSVPSRSANS